MSQLPVEWLRSPDNGQPLHLSAAGELQSSDGAFMYSLENGIAVLLPRSRPLPDYAIHYQQDAELFDYGDEWADDPLAQTDNRRLREQILAALPAGEELLLLDVGCGSGWLAAAALPRGHRVVSMDISTVNPIRALQKLPSERHFGLVADAMQLPFAPELFDAIVASEVIEHVKDPAAFIESLLSRLKSGGRLIVTTPYDEKIQYCLCIHCNKPTPHSAHLHSFTPRKLLSFLPANLRAAASAVGFANNYLLKSRLQYLLRFLPAGWWQLTDRLANRLFGKPLRLMMVVQKPTAGLYSTSSLK